MRDQDKNTEADLKDIAERYRSVVDNIVDGIVTIDECGTIKSFNPAAERIFGWTAADIIGRNISIFMPESYRSQHDHYLRDYLDTGEKKIIGFGREVMGQRRDGSTFPMDLAVSESYLGDQRIFTGIVRDITERKRLEAQLLQAQKMESVGQLAGGVAHDFNNQLGIILFDVDILISSSDPNSSLYEDLQKIRKVVLRSANLTRQLLIFSRRQHMEPQAVYLNQQVGELQKMLSRLLREDVVVELALAEDLWSVYADPGNMDQIIINLALNSRDAMPDGGTLYLETANVTVDEEYVRRHPQARTGRFAKLVVGDTGTGMSADVREHIFEPFFTTKEAGKGTGLGLSVVYGIVQAHEGWIDVESKPSAGTRFEIFLPGLEGDSETKRLTSTAAHTIQYQGGGERLLLVEDETELRERTERVLTDSGYAVRSFSTIAAADIAFHQEGEHFDLVLSDAVLPDGMGPDLVLRLCIERKNLAALLMTGYTDERIDWERVHAENLTVLQKPFSVNDLLAQVRAALRKRQG